jgi:hypothetical protein
MKQFLGCIAAVVCKIVLFEDTTMPEFPDVWQVLGPFSHGSREVGIDPLSPYGGFENIVYSDQRYPSDLGDDGKVGWQIVHTNPDGTVGPVIYPNVHWESLQVPFGWAILNHVTYLFLNTDIFGGY